MSLRPLHDWVLVQMTAVPLENVTSGGIVLTHPELIRHGTVVAVGPGRLYSDGVYKPTELKPGDRVTFLAATMDTKQGHQLADAVLEKDQALIREPDVLFVVEDGDPRVER